MGSITDNFKNAKVVQPKFDTNALILVIVMFILFTIRMSAPFAIMAITIFLFALTLFDTFVLKVPCIFYYRIDFECPCCGHTTHTKLSIIEKNIKNIDHITLNCKICSNTYEL